MKKLSQSRSSFAEGAERLGEVAREVKAQQITDVQGPLPQAQRMSVMAPDEVWARKFMTQGIGTQPDIIGVSNMTPMPHATFVMAEVTPRAPTPVIAKPAIIEREAPMNMRIGRKEERPKRSWLGRLLRGT